jgi:hypothetical protein
MGINLNLAAATLRKMVFILGMLSAQLISFYALTFQFSNFDVIKKSVNFRLDIWNLPSSEFYPVIYWLLFWNIFSGILFFTCLIMVFENFKPLMKLVFYLIIIGQVIFFMCSMSISLNFGLSMAVTAFPPTFAVLTRLSGWW